MPPPGRKGCQHHYFWYPGRGIRTVVIGCAHCPVVSKVLDLAETYDQDLLDRQIESSRNGHASICTRPVFAGF